MNNIDYVACLVYLVPEPNISYTGVDVDYDDIKWLDERPQPSRQDCIDVWPSLYIKLENESAERKRRDEYRNVSDPLFFKWQRGESTEQEWLDSVSLIKSKFPKIDL